MNPYKMYGNFRSGAMPTSLRIYPNSSTAVASFTVSFIFIGLAILYGVMTIQLSILNKFL